MSLARFAKKRDAAEPAIVAALKAAGCRVWKLDRPFDLLVGIPARQFGVAYYHGRFVVLEVKSTARQRKDQQHQADELADAQAGGLPVFRVQTVDEAVRAVSVFNQHHGDHR